MVYGIMSGMKKLVMMCGVAAAVLSAGARPLDNLGNVRLRGPLGERLDRMIRHRVVDVDIDYLVGPFMEKTERHGWWQTEFWGKFMHAAESYQAYRPSETLKASIARGVEAILASQEACGYIGNYPDELRCGEGWDVWGMKYTMLGLLHHYDATGDARCLSAAKRLCDYVIREIGPGGARGRELWQTGNWSGMPSSSVLEPVVWLYERTKERKYLDFATYVVKGMSVPAAGPRLVDLALRGVPVADRNGHGNKAETGGGYVKKQNRWKAYEMMSCYQGLLEYAECADRSGLSAEIVRDNPWLEKLGGVEALRRAAVATAEDIVREEVMLSGGCSSSEAWFHGARKQHLPFQSLQETCVTTTWMRFCEKLLDVTGEAKWADEIERTFYNAYLASLKADDSLFAAYVPMNGNRSEGMHHCFMHADCCSANAPRGFLCFLKKLFETKGNAAVFNFYASAQVKGELADGRKVAFDVYSIYPRENYVRIVSHTEGAGNVPLSLRIPAWATKGAKIQLNGEDLAGAKAGEYFTIDREWKLGDVVWMEFEMPVVAHTIADRPAAAPGPYADASEPARRMPHYVAFTRGPVLLARSSRFADGDLTEPFRVGAVEDGMEMPGFSPVRVPDDGMWMAFNAVLPIGSHTENPEARNPSAVSFCDFASAGNRWERGDYYRTWFPIEWGPTE